MIEQYLIFGIAEDTTLIGSPLFDFTVSEYEIVLPKQRRSQGPLPGFFSTLARLRMDAIQDNRCFCASQVALRIQAVVAVPLE